VHMSTQTGITNYEMARVWRELGASRVILARELSLEEIQEIDKIICSDTGHYVENTHTRNCAAVLTIYCC